MPVAADAIWHLFFLAFGQQIWFFPLMARTLTVLAIDQKKAMLFFSPTARTLKVLAIDRKANFLAKTKFLKKCQCKPSSEFEEK